MQSMLKVVSRINRAIGTSLASRACEHLRQGDYDQLVTLRTRDPSDYESTWQYKADAQVVALTKKLEGLPVKRDLHTEAIKTFYECEAQCAETNKRLALCLNWFERGFVGDSVDEELYLYIGSVRKIIADVLGPIPQDLVPRLSGGSTYYDKGDEITIPHKMSARPSVTDQCYAVVGDLWRGTAWYRAHDLSAFRVRGNRFTSVAKDSTKNRGICVEPSLNVGYQLSVGSHIRERLYTVAGIDIKGRPGRPETSAQSVHRRLARAASVQRNLSTLDLSNASDTISLVLVKLLLPKGWFDLLSALRSPETNVNGQWIKLHKFSSMGNGFTFELETLLFFAIAKAIYKDGFVSAYGDDLIVPHDESESLRPALKFFGFVVNRSKSFTSSAHPFRESCGGDYLCGEAVRPIYLKTLPATPSEWMALHNRVVEIEEFLELDLSAARAVCIGNLPISLRLFGPRGPDDRLWSEDRDLWITRQKRGLCGCLKDGPPPLVDLGYVELKVLREKSRRVALTGFSPSVVLASALLGTPSQGPVPRDGISGYRTAWSPIVI